MPKKKPQKRRDTTKFKEALLAERDRLRERLRALDAGEENDGGVQDSIDAASDASIRDVLRGITANEGEQLRRVDAALARIDAGTYGDCDACGERIEPERLEALPFAVTCIACKRQEEKKRPSAPPR